MKGRRQNASSTAEDAGRKASATGGRTPTCRENHSIGIKQVRLELLPILDLTTKSGCGAVIREATTECRMQSTPTVPCPALVERTKCETCDDHSARTCRDLHAMETEHRQHYTCLRTGVATDGYDGDIGVGSGWVIGADRGGAHYLGEPEGGAHHPEPAVWNDPWRHTCKHTVSKNIIKHGKNVDQCGPTPLMPLLAWARLGYATTSVGLPRLCRCRGQAALVTGPLDSVSTPGPSHKLSFGLLRYKSLRGLE